jgi:rRNA-processing protein FCF1
MLLDAVKFNVDIITEAQKFGRPFTLENCIEEIENLSKSKGKLAEQSRVALQLSKWLPVAKTEGYGDAAILGYSVKHGCSVATNDKRLIKTLKSKGIKILRLRQKKYLVEY